MSAVKCIYHMCVDIRGAINWPNSRLKSLFCDAGKPVSAEAAREHLLDQLQMGRKVIPFGKPCEGFSYESGCPGHIKKSELAA